MQKLLIILLVALNTVCYGQHSFDGSYSGANVPHIAFPIGGIGAGLFCLEGTGTVSHMSIHHHPEVFNEPVMFASVYIEGRGAKVLEGPVPNWKKYGQHDNARGGEGTDYGLARFQNASFTARFPFAKVTLKDKRMPVNVSLTGWSPFIPADADNSSLSIGALEYTIKNTSAKNQSGVFSYSAENFTATDVGTNRIQPTGNGFILSQLGTAANPEKQCDLAIFTDEPSTTIDYCWFRGGWWDPLTMAWKKIAQGNTKAIAPVAKDAPGASLYVCFSLRPGESKTIRVYLCWYVPYSHLRSGEPSNQKSDTTVNDRENDQPSPYYMPWYASKFKNINEVITYWKDNYDRLRKNTKLFTDAFYNSTLPPEVLEALASNLTILKSPTVLRQYDGRFWGWEGSNDNTGSCAGSCTHVYNYAQALCHLFPGLDRTIIETELGEGLDAEGHQNYREALPIRPEGHDEFPPAADGQLGGVIRLYRDWRIAGNDDWLKALYPKAKLSLDYCIKTFDPDHNGTLTEPHHNTYDIEFWGADGMCTSIYLGALEAFIKMGKYLHEGISTYQALYSKGKKAMESQLYNGQYFVQDIQWKGLHHRPDTTGEDYRFPEAKALLEKEGPKYQYGTGCLSDGVIGSWMARVSGLPDPIDEKEVKSHLTSIYKYNFKTDLSNFSNPQRSTYALGNEGGLLLCTWPKGGQLSLPFVYSNEVWTGIEYEIASHLIFEGKVNEGLNIVKATRKRYDGTARNSFDEYECGHWYMRAMSSYALLEALTGVRYDAVTKTLYVNSKIGDFTSFLSTDTGFGNVIYKNGNARLNVVYGRIDVQDVQIIHLKSREQSY